MNYSGLKCLFKVALNANVINTCRPIVISSSLLQNKFATSCVWQKGFSASSYVNDLTFFETIRQKVRLQFRKTKLRSSGYYLYESVADHLDYNAFFKELEMPDTFNSWFLITELHVWMLLARLMADPQFGRFTRNTVVEALWKDVVTRAKKLGPEHASVVNTQVKELSEEFQAALVNYDEGILSDDTVLAGALWRRLYSRNCTAHQLEGMVKYVRQSIFLLDSLGTEDFLTAKRIKWLKVSDVFKTLPT